METQNQTMNTNKSQGFLSKLEDFFNTYLHKKAPFHLPPAAREWIVKYGPWIVLILMILAVPVILAAFSLSAILGPFAAGYAPARFYTVSIISEVINLLALIIQIAALPGLFKRTLKSWHLLYYAVLISAVAQLLNGEIFSLIFNVVISMYFLFEVREYYK
jgi:hypothetical protein